MKTALTIAGSDPSAGAGLQADLKTFAALGVYGLTVVSSLTAQNTTGVRGIHVVPPEFVALQIEAIYDDLQVDAVKTGMLANTAIIREVSRQLTKRSAPNVVVDPVMVATSGDLLMGEPFDQVLEAFRNFLLPVALVATPNIPEAEILTGLPIRNLGEMKTAAIELHNLGAANIVVKGGHLETGDLVTDLLFDGQEFFIYHQPRIATNNTHGTGCTFAAALAVGLAKGQAVGEAVGEAQRFVRVALEKSYAVGRGGGPPNHFGALYERCGQDA